MKLAKLPLSLKTHLTSSQAEKNENHQFFTLIEMLVVLISLVAGGKKCLGRQVVAEFPPIIVFGKKISLPKLN